MASLLLEVKDIRVKYGNIEALKGVSFEVYEGEIISLIGANGAGKKYNPSRDQRIIKTCFR